jgi:hypothetical protein
MRERRFAWLLLTATEKGGFMSGMVKMLIVANPSIESEEVRAAIVEHAAAGPVHVTLVEPAAVGAGPLCAPRVADDGGGVERLRRASVERLQRAVLQLRAAGVEVEGIVGGEFDALEAGQDWDPTRFDEVVVSCVPWLSLRRAGSECACATP